MFPTFIFDGTKSNAGSERLAGFGGGMLFRIGILAAICCAENYGVVAANASDFERKTSGVVINQVVQFRSLLPEAFLGQCAFRLDGVVTLVDTNRNLLVVQDETGAVALNPSSDVRDIGLLVGQRAVLEGARCVPHVVGFSGFPYRSSGLDLLPSLEAAANRGYYYLTRMRGYLRPPATGEYTFWVASDNSSELWLSPDADPTKVKKIAFQARYSWVAPREWSHYPSQRSESVLLQAGQAYYLDIFHEQTTGADHLAVAWQGPTVPQAIIAATYLTPWGEPRDKLALSATNGVLQEYWTNFTSGSLASLTGPRPFESILSVDEVQVEPRGDSAWPRPQSITLNQPLKSKDNFIWVEAQGYVTFTGRNGSTDFLELSDGTVRVQVRLARSDAASLRRWQNATVRVVGVCEGVYDPKGVLVPGLIWVAQESDIFVVEAAKTNPAATTSGQSSKLVLTNSNPAMLGFYGTRGVVTFNDRVFGRDYMFVQEDTAAMSVSLKDRNFGNHFEVGRWVDLGGSFQAGKNIPTLSPMVITELGWRSMPAPMTQPVQFPVPGSRDGRWTEVEGVVHTVNSNGTVTLMGSGGPLSIWIGKTPAAELNQYVDARLRVRGVLSLTLQDDPLLLAPSPGFVVVEQEPPSDPFAVLARSSQDFSSSDVEAAISHRVKLAGKITFVGKRRFFLQDAVGGVCVQTAEEQELRIGQAVEVVGFPAENGSVRTLTEALLRFVDGGSDVLPQKLDAGEGVSFKHAGTLVQISANLIAQRNKDGSQVLELQEKQRIFEAELSLKGAPLPTFAPGSRIQLIGVCDFAAVAPAVSGNVTAESPSTGALKIWLRSPLDVVLVSGPPWWTWKYTVALVGGLLTVLVVSLLRIHLLRLRLERQLAFSRQILESQESERHRIAVNLHDSLGQNLLVIKNQARLAMQPATDESALRQRLDEISGCASQAIEEVREITHALRPYQLDRLGLTQTIRATVSRAAENSSILFASHADDVDGLFDKESEIHVYRIVQEAVNNILKHSAATEAAVVVKRFPATVSISIRDNGRGFDAASQQNFISHDVGHGLSGIKERVRILGGTFLVDSRLGHGTTLSIEMPVSVSKHEAT